MDRSKKKLRVCLICVVAAAVIIGLCYYYTSVRKTDAVSDGTLVSSVCTGLRGLWQ